MGWVDSLRGSIIGLDTAPIIYFIEEHPTYLPTLRPLFDALEHGEVQVVTSTLTLAEVLVQPFRHGRNDLVHQYREILLGAPGLTTIPLTASIAERAAQLRALHNLRTPDAIQMATALQAGASNLLTNDTRIPDLPNLSRLILNDLVSHRAT